MRRPPPGQPSQKRCASLGGRISCPDGSDNFPTFALLINASVRGIRDAEADCQREIKCAVVAPVAGAMACMQG
jgi:hypothetical protein